MSAAAGSHENEREDDEDVILGPGPSKKKGGSQETCCVIAIWSEESIQRKLDDTYRNRRIYEDISRQMSERGYSRTWLQCQRKINHLKVTYCKTKDSRSGLERITCPFYEELDIVLGDRPSFFPGAGTVCESEVGFKRDEPVNSSLLTETEGDDSFLRRHHGIMC